MTAWISIVAISIGLLAGLKWLVAKIGCTCHRCGERMLTWNALADDARKQIMAYFENHENRTPATTSIFVCASCRFVYDDFSGERLSMEGSDKSFCKVCSMPHVHYLGQFAKAMELDGFRVANPEVLDKTECLNCRRNPLGAGDCIACDTGFKVRGCRNCFTLFAWIEMMQNKFRFNVPFTRSPILAKGPKRTGW